VSFSVVSICRSPMFRSCPPHLCGPSQRP